MKRIIVVFLLLSTLITCISCQPTPKEPVVVSKNDGKLEKIIHSEPAPHGKYSAPSEWTENIPSLTNDDTEIRVDAKITVPDVDSFPVYYVMPSEEMTQEYADRLMNYFIGDEELVDGTTPPKTKNEILERILVIENELYDSSSDFNTEDKRLLSDDDWEQAKKARENEIKELEREYASAPATVSDVPVSREFTEHRDEQGNLTGYIIFGVTKSRNAIVHITKDAEHPNIARGAMIALTDKGGYLKTTVYSDTDIAEYGMKNYTFDSARKLADSMLADIGKNGFDVQFSASCIVHQIKSAKEDEPQNKYRGYVFYYTQKVSGIPLLLEFDSAEANEYNRTWRREYLSVVVSNDGVCTYNENSSMKVTDKINDNVPLLSFDKVQNIFKQYISMKLSTFVTDAYTPDKRSVSITDIRLGYLRIAEKDRTDRAYLFPVWIFYGNETLHFNSPEDIDLHTDENGDYTPYNNVGHGYLCINAIDGSIIDLTQGY